MASVYPAAPEGMTRGVVESLLPTAILSALLKVFNAVLGRGPQPTYRNGSGVGPPGRALAVQALLVLLFFQAERPKVGAHYDLDDPRFG